MFDSPGVKAAFDNIEVRLRAADRLGVIDVRKIATTYAPRFENLEIGVRDGCFLATGVTAADATWSIDSGDVLTGRRYVIGDAVNEKGVRAGCRRIEQHRRAAGLRGIDGAPFATRRLTESS